MAIIKYLNVGISIT